MQGKLLISGRSMTFIWHTAMLKLLSILENNSHSLRFIVFPADDLKREYSYTRSPDCLDVFALD